MLIALDYDDTFTRDPDRWYAAMNLMKMGGHTIIGVTMRSPGQMGNVSLRYTELCDKIYCTSLHAKKPFLEKMGVFPHVWIDDTPEFILHNALGAV